MGKKVTTKTEDREKYAVYLDKDSLKVLRQYQQDVGVPVSESIRRAVVAYLKNLK